VDTLYVKKITLYHAGKLIQVNWPITYFVSSTKRVNGQVAQWGRTAKNRDVSTRPFARPFARLLAPLTRGKVNF